MFRRPPAPPLVVLLPVVRARRHGALPGPRQAPTAKELRRLRVLAGAAAGVAATALAGHGSRPWSSAACAAAAARPPCVISVEKPESHKRRSYEYLCLPNGMRVMLASDPACDKAATALCVGVGRLHEPKELPGLAHFCEHMLFLGTEQFPDEGDYKRFVKGHGGYCNAATGDASTCYAFDISPGHLGGALDRFSAFFRSPLFDASATQREINAVDSEHSMRITDDGRRSYATLLLDANPRHPLHWGSGNAQSLRDGPLAQGLDVREEVLAFYRKNYSSEDMTLAVLGREPLGTLRSMVEDRFAAVRQTGTRALRGEQHGGQEPALLPQNFPGVVLRVPSKDIRRVSFSWQLSEWQTPLWESKPTAYASFLLGHEGEGSLLSVLKARGWATALYAGADNFGCFSHFEVSVSLTELGLENVAQVGELVFRFVRLVRSSPTLAWATGEMQRLREIKFRFADDAQPYGLVNQLARNLQEYPPQKVLSAGPLLPRPDAAASRGVLRHLTVDGVRVELVAKKFQDQCTSTDPWYQGRYLRQPLDASWRDAWLAAEGGASSLDSNEEREDAERRAAEDGMRLPKPNPFVPEGFDLRPRQGAVQPHPGELAPVNGLARSFHRQDDRFLQPKAVVGFRFFSPEAARDAASYLRGQVWCEAVNEQLSEFAYDASQAGLSYNLGAIPGGVELSISGFSDKLPLLVRAVARKMRQASEVPPDVFSLVLDRFQRSLHNTVYKQRPCDLAARRCRELRHALAFPAEERLEALGDLGVAELNGEGTRLLGECRVEALMMGNLAPGDAASLGALLNEELGTPREPSSLPTRAEAELPEGYTVWYLDGTNEEEQNGAVRLEIQIPAGTDNSVYSSLLVRVLNPRFFAELRTKQQLGYIVQMSWVEGESFLTLQCTVQTEYSTGHVRGQIDTFLEEQLSWLGEELSEQEFVRQRDGLASNLAEEPKNLREEFGRYWPEVTRQRYDFGRREARRAAVEAATLDGLRAFAQGALQGSPRLYVEVGSTSDRPRRQPELGPERPPRDPDRVWRGLEDAARFRAAARWAEPPARPPPAAPPSRL